MSKRLKPRLKGYYICKIPCCSEFIHDIPMKQQKCPYCGNMADRLAFMNSMDIDNYKERRICDALGITYEAFG